jgi:hypothetical protein
MHLARFSNSFLKIGFQFQIKFVVKILNLVKPGLVPPRTVFFFLKNPASLLVHGFLSFMSQKNRIFFSMQW